MNYIIAYETNFLILHITNTLLPDNVNINNFRKTHFENAVYFICIHFFLALFIVTNLFLISH